MELQSLPVPRADRRRLLRLNDEAFPREERIPSRILLPFLRHHGCETMAAYDGEFIGFVSVLPMPQLKMAYIWYLAVESPVRSRGYGAQILRALVPRYPGWQLVVDMERPDPHAGNNAQRLRRIAFYERCGYSRTGYGMRYFDVDYEILARGEFRCDDFDVLLLKMWGRKLKPELTPLSAR